MCSNKPVELPMPVDCTVQNLLDFLTGRALDGCVCVVFANWQQKYCTWAFNV